MKKTLIIVLATVSLFAMTLTTYAAIPNVSATLTGSGDNVALTVSGDSNSSVLLTYNGSSGLQMSALGTTDASGYFSTTISTAVYGIIPNSAFHITVNNQQSSTLQWPYTTVISTTESFYLSQTSVTLTIGQSLTITANNNANSSLYLSSNSNPTVANVAISGNQFTVTANNSGSTSVTVCSLANSSNCGTVSITVQSAGAQSLTFSQNNVSIGYGQNVQITISGGTGIYSVTSNSNPSVIQTAINGSSINLYANSTSGSATITVCSTNMSSCGVINATASAAITSSVLSFSQTNPGITPGQTVAITVSGGSGSYYVASNSNTGAVQANLIGSTLTLYGNAAGSAILNVCSSTGGCGIITATVAIPGSVSMTLSQSNISLTIGQIFNLIVTGIGNYSVYSNSNPSVASAAISGSTAAVTALNTGTTEITFCQSSDGQCASAYITVTSTGTSSITLSQTSIALTVGQISNIIISGVGSYYISSNSNPSVASAAINGSTATVTAIGTGNSNIVVCQSNGQCVTLYVTVNAATTGSSSSSIIFNQVLSVGQGVNLLISGGSGAYYLSSNSGTIFTANITNNNVLMLVGVSAGMASINVCSSDGGCVPVYVTVVNSTSTASSAVSTVYKFYNPLNIGSKGTDVTELQKRLTAEGVYSGPVTGYYGSLTQTAVKKYQVKYGLSQLGNVGPATRAMLNQ